MYSKVMRRAWLTSLCGLLLLVNLSCSMPLGESPPETIPPQSGFEEQTQCLEQLIPNFENYFEGSARDSQVRATWGCLSGVVGLFQTSIRGRQEDRFSSRELANFVEQYFLKNKKISASTMTEVFRIKQLLVGGDGNFISRQEINQLLVVIHKVGEIALGLNPYMKVYALHWKVKGADALDSDLKYFENANLQMQAAAKDLGALIEKNGKAYKIDHFVSLLKEMSQYGSTNWSWLKGLEDALPLIHKLKKTLTDGDEAVIQPHEWHRFALLGGRGYIQYLRYYYFFKSVDSIGSGPELVFITRSIDDLFSFIGDMVAGTKDQKLTRSEVLEILQSLAQFLPHFKISDAFLVEVMKIKCLFFGGSIDYFEKSDFDRAREKLNEFRILTEKFLAYASVYGLSWDSHAMAIAEALRYFQAADSNLIEFGARLGMNMEGRYDLKDLLKLGKEYQMLTQDSRDSNQQSWEELSKKWVPILIVIKNVIFSDEDSIVGKSSAVNLQQRESEVRKQWSDFFKFGSQLYSKYTFYHYFLQEEEVLQGRGLRSLAFFVKDVSKFLQELLAQKPAIRTQQISFLEWSRLWVSLKEAKIIPEKISIQTMNGLTKVLMQKILVDPRSRLTGAVPQGLTKAGIDQINSEFSIWLKNQEFLEIVYTGVPTETGRLGSEILVDLNQAVSTVGLEELKTVYRSPVALSFDSQGRMFLKNPGAPYLRQNSDLINLVRSAVRLVIRSYAMEERRTDSLKGSLNLAEANAFFSDFRPILVELGLLDPKLLKFMESRFREANVFTAGGNGDDYMNLKEGSELILMIMSGFKIDSLFFAKLDATCPMVKSSEYKFDWVLNLSCAQDLYRREILEQFSSMPEFVSYLATLSPSQFQGVFINLLKASGYRVNAQGTLKIGDLTLFPQVSQYVEMAYQKYDRNHDGYFVTSEVMLAYPVFRNTLKEAAAGKLTSDENLKALLAWLLVYETPPSTLVDYFRFFTWWVPLGEAGWNVHANREKFIKVLGVMADSVNGTARSSLIEIPESLQQYAP